MGITISEQEIEEAFQKADIDLSGHVDFHEATDFLIFESREIANSIGEKVFNDYKYLLYNSKQIDNLLKNPHIVEHEVKLLFNGQEELAKDQFKQVFEKAIQVHKLPFTPEDAEHLFHEIDLDQSETVSPLEAIDWFINLLYFEHYQLQSTIEGYYEAFAGVGD